YVLLVAAIFIIALSVVQTANVTLAPLLNDPSKIDEVAGILASDRTYYTYDLNIETRRLRHQHIQRLNRTPEVAVLGASHWQEGHSYLGKHADLYNAHVHRDYYEDILAVTEMFVRYGKLPPKMIITIRDNLFTPVDDRTDFLWVPVLADYRAMATRLGIPAHDAYTNGITPQLRQRLSLPLLQANIERYMRAPIKPYSSTEKSHPTLDTLLPDGSIQWSTLHNEAFTAERSRREALAFAEQRRNHPPVLDEMGVASVDKLLEFLSEAGVEVYLAHPPFNPIYWDTLQGSPYMEGVRRVEDLTKMYAAKYNFKVIGGFNPHKVGCTEEQYIDAEHSRPECLARIIDEFLTLDKGKVSPTG
ncbi:MAG: hypothetical protein ACR2OM_15410, partial [Aestuariivirgaceae bacterium]